MTTARSPLGQLYVRFAKRTINSQSTAVLTVKSTELFYDRKAESKRKKKTTCCLFHLVNRDCLLTFESYDCRRIVYVL